MTRSEYASLMLPRLQAEKARLTSDFRKEGVVQSCSIDSLLPEAAALEIFSAFPDKSEMMLKKSLREFKYVAAQMNKYNPLLEEIIYAFQDPRIVQIVGEITGLEELIPDDNLYAGGISLMAQGNYLEPHLDNSHDKDRANYRVLNLLYYVTPNWQKGYGGNLELWDSGPKGLPREIESRFNRLVLMATHKESWHSVNRVEHDGSRCCVSNYYFSPKPLEPDAYFHVTSFRGRPEEPVRDLVLRADIALRTGLRKVFKKGVRENPHVYKRPAEPPVKPKS
jgi:Rps23 Pro-64 3,4-dihydroxylase Tpa1-like proline 4-hydroxylase